jgi:hypothetical protein
MAVSLSHHRTVQTVNLPMMAATAVTRIRRHRRATQHKQKCELGRGRRTKEAKQERLRLTSTASLVPVENMPHHSNRQEHITHACRQPAYTAFAVESNNFTVSKVHTQPLSSLVCPMTFFGAPVGHSHV